MMVKTAHPTGRRRIGRAAVAGAALATLGIGAMQTAPAGAAAPTAAPAVTPAKAAAVSWNLVGVFPDPVTCTIAGATTGRPFYCGFYFFFWGLNVLY